MIELDGKDAGGQYLRTAVALSAITGKPVKISNIRGGRPEPGLKHQHIEGITAIGELCNAKIDGLILNSKELTFEPQQLAPKDLEIEISTAGSIGLVLQALLLVTSQLKQPIKIHFKGGATYNKWAPPVAYIEQVFLPLLGEKTKIKIIKEGFYPKGGAEVEVETAPWEAKKIEIINKSLVQGVYGVSSASLQLQRGKVAERQVDAAGAYIQQKLGKVLDCQCKYASTESRGSGIMLFIKTDNGIIGADALGAIEKTAEEVGREAARYLVDEYFSGPVDRHAADMLLPYMALVGEGKIATTEITNHIITNVHVIEKFLPVKFEIDKAKKTIEVKQI